MCKDEGKMSASPSGDMNQESIFGGGEMGERVLSFDWSRTPLGPREHWSESLRMAAGLVLASSFPMVLHWGPDLIVLYNDAYREIAASRHPGVLGRPTREVWPSHEPVLTAVIERRASTFLSDQPCPVLRGGREEEAYFSIAYIPVGAMDGLVGGVIVAMIETTSRKRIEEALRASEELLRKVVENSRDGINLLDLTTGRYVFMSPAQVELTGFTTEEMNDLPVEDAYARMHPEDREISVQQQAEIAAGRDLSGTVEYRWKVKSGEYRWFRDSRKLVRDAQGHPVGLVGVSRDITELKHAEELRVQLERRLFEAQKMESLGVLAGGVAHDFNNILTGLLGNTELALLNVPAQSPIAKRLDFIRGGILQLAELTRQMLAYAGKGQFVLGPANLNEAVAQVTGLLNASLSKKATLEYDLAAESPTVRGDAAQLAQAALNLINNAVEALGDQTGTVRVATGVVDADRAYLSTLTEGAGLPPGRYAFLEVADTGCGMDEGTRKRLFEPFFSTKFVGRGLGLAAVLGIVRGHHGALDVHSEVGAGSTFRVLFPSVDPHVAAEPGAPSALESRGLVLVVDDEEIVRSTASAMLNVLGFDVVLARDGQEAVDLMRRRAHEVDLVLMDLAMPLLDGLQATREIRDFAPQARIVLSSGYDQEESLKRFGGLGLAGFLAKPYDLRQVSVLFEAALRGRGL